MDAVYNHITPRMRQHLCDVLESLWQEAVAERRQLSERSSAGLLDRILKKGPIRGGELPGSGRGLALLASSPVAWSPPK